MENLQYFSDEYRLKFVKSIHGLEFSLLKQNKEFIITYGNGDTRLNFHIEMKNDEYLFQFALNYSY